MNEDKRNASLNHELPDGELDRVFGGAGPRARPSGNTDRPKQLVPVFAFRCVCGEWNTQDELDANGGNCRQCGQHIDTQACPTDIIGYR